MRTTLTLDDDVLRLIQDAVHRERRSMKDVVNDALRCALREPTSTEFVARVHHSALAPGLTHDDLTHWSTSCSTTTLLR